MPDDFGPTEWITTAQAGVVDVIPEGLRRLISMRCLLVVFLAVVSAASVSSCRPSTPIDRSLLTDEPCAAPCWQGLVPGVSTVGDARQVLETCPYVSPSGYSEERRGTETKLLQWHSRNCPECMLNTMAFEDNVVLNIHLALTYAVTVEEVVQKFGTPEGISAYVDGISELFFGVSLFYPSRGLGFFTRGPYDQHRIEPTTLVKDVSYSVPTSFDDPSRFSPWFLEWIQPWPGYGELEHVLRIAP